MKVGERLICKNIKDDNIIYNLIVGEYYEILRIGKTYVDLVSDDSQTVSIYEIKSMCVLFENVIDNRNKKLKTILKDNNL